MPLLCFNWGLAGRCAHKTPAIGGRFPHLRPEKCKLSRTWKSAKRRRWRMKRAGFEEVARLARPKGRGNRNATTVTSEKTIQIYFASADAKVCDAWVRWAVSRPQGAKCAGGVRAGRCFALEERKMRAWGGAETLFCARGAQNACFLECCFAPGGRKRRIFRFDEA